MPTAVSSWVGWQLSCGTSEFRWSCAPAPTCRPARSQASPSIRSTYWLGRFRVTVNTDNRLMSDTSMSLEMHRLVEAFGYGWSDLARFTVNAMKSAFIPFDQRLAIIDEVIKPRFAALMGHSE